MTEWKVITFTEDDYAYIRLCNDIATRRLLRSMAISQVYNQQVEYDRMKNMKAISKLQ